MATTLQFALSNPVAGMEDEFNRWYGSEHLEHGVTTPGISAGQRFRRAAAPWPAGRHDYLMIWEIDDPAFALSELAKAREAHIMDISPAIDMATVQPPTMWLRASVRSAARVAVDTSSRGTIVLALYNAGEGADAVFGDALVKGGLAELADLPGVVSADYLTLADEQIRGNARKFPHGLLIELHDEAAALSALEDRLPALPHADRERWFATLFRPLDKRMTTKDVAQNEVEQGRKVSA